MTKKTFTILLVLIILSGCTSNQSKNSSPKEADITQISTKKATNQDASNQAKQSLKKYNEVTSIVAVNTTKKVVVGVNVHQKNRFHLKSLRKKWKSKLKKSLPKMDISVTTDQKIIWELTDLETRLKETSMSKKDLQKKLKKIIKLMNENA
ncbi:MAG TPA: YhcN/YlaJ family sporulation lipoprotein [Virgibacillus sp.]|nr:YhcN/YlaJ family sporulation lipoprotein [Virgibacillus sp.]